MGQSPAQVLSRAPAAALGGPYIAYSGRPSLQSSVDRLQPAGPDLAIMTVAFIGVTANGRKNGSYRPIFLSWLLKVWAGPEILLVCGAYAVLVPPYPVPLLGMQIACFYTNLLQNALFSQGLSHPCMTTPTQTRRGSEKPVVQPWLGSPLTRGRRFTAVEYCPTQTLLPGVA